MSGTTRDGRGAQAGEFDAPIGNPPERIAWWDYRGDPPSLDPMPRSLLPCGCHIRQPDYESVLCPEHLAELNAPHPIPPVVPAPVDPNEGGRAEDCLCLGVNICSSCDDGSGQ